METSEYKRSPFADELLDHYLSRNDLTDDEIELVYAIIDCTDNEVTAQTFAAHFENSTSPLTVGGQTLYESAQQILKRKDIKP